MSAYYDIIITVFSVPHVYFSVYGAGLLWQKVTLSLNCIFIMRIVFYLLTMLCHWVKKNALNQLKSLYQLQLLSGTFPFFTTQIYEDHLDFF